MPTDWKGIPCLKWPLLHPVAALFSARHTVSKDQSLESTRSGNGNKVRRRGPQGLEFLKCFSQKAWHNEAGVSVVLVIVLGCLLCCSNQWSEAGEGLGNLQELML